MTLSTIAVLALVGLLVPGDVGAYDSHCGFAAVECPDGFATARTRWGVPDGGGNLDERAEHARLWLETFAASGLPASLNADIVLPVFTGDEVFDISSRSYATVRPVLTGAARRQVRVTSLPELTQLPDFSFTLWDWAAGNETCPPGPLNADVCHRYFPHIGMLNSSHMVPQAERFYAHYHRLALERARQCAATFAALPEDHRERFETFVLACEKEALALEAVGQHYLQDAWSMGHMWERWGGPEFTDFGPAPLGDRTLGAAIAAYTGIIHGAGSMLPPGFDDPLCAPHPGVGYVDGSPATPGEQLGLGDVFLDEVLLVAADGTAYAAQRRAVFGCAVDGMRSVYAETARRHGELRAARTELFDASRRVTDASCFGQRATNQALAIGFGLHFGTQPNQEPLLEVFPEAEILAEPGTTNEAFPAGILAFAFANFASFAGLQQFTEEEALFFAEDAAAAATEAATRGLDPATGLDTDLASGGLPPILGIRPNAHFARGSATEPPSTYADPFLPWELRDPDPVVQEREQALALTFADAHAADRCGELLELDLLEYRALAENADPAVAEARCGQCEQMVTPHLRFGRPGNHHPRREAFCALVGPPDAAFVFTDEDPATFTNTEPTDLASVRAAAREWCRCAPPPPTSLAGLWIGRATVSSDGGATELCAGMTISGLPEGPLQVVYANTPQGFTTGAFTTCAPIFEATPAGSTFAGPLVNHSGACCRTCPGQNRGIENGCRITASVTTADDGQPHLTGSFDTFSDACVPGVATTTFDLSPPGPPRCGDCVVEDDEECEPPGTDACQADCRRPPEED